MSSSDSERVIEYARVRAIALRIALGTTLVLFAVLALLDRGLRSEHAPRGIVSLELAGSDAALILGEWSEAQRRDALLLQGLDYLFIPAYAALLATAALTLGEPLGGKAPRLARLRIAAAWSAALAGLADVIENVPLILMLRDGSANPNGAALAMVCATLKFALLLTVTLYLICARVVRSTGR